MQRHDVYATIPSLTLTAFDKTRSRKLRWEATADIQTGQQYSNTGIRKLQKHLETETGSPNKYSLAHDSKLIRYRNRYRFDMTLKRQFYIQNDTNKLQLSHPFNYSAIQFKVWKNGCKLSRSRTHQSLSFHRIDKHSPALAPVTNEWYKHRMLLSSVAANLVIKQAKIIL